MRVVADDRIPFLKGALEPYAEVVYLPGKSIVRESLVGADALIIRTRTRCDEGLLKGTGVRFIGTATIGYDHIDTRFCDSSGISWTNAPGCNSSSVRQYIAAALLKIATEKGFRLRDKTLGIVGVGNVGSKVEKFARAIGMKVLLNDPPRARREGKSKFVGLDHLLAESDIVTVHVPLDPAGPDRTYHLFSTGSFSKMKPGAWFINSSRGEVTDTEAIRDALDAERIAGTVLDVWENEPDIDLDLLGKAFLATPHIAGYSTDGKANGTAMVVNELCSYFSLPLKNWYPVNVPDPLSPEVTIDCEGKDEQDILDEAVRHTYNISEDDAKLRNSPADFENIRGGYPLRREFPSFRVNLRNGTEILEGIINEIGFKADRS